MQARSISGDSVEGIRSAIDAEIVDGFSPKLAIVFLSIQQDRVAICGLLEARGISILGATTAGEFIDGNIGEESTAMMLLDIDPTHFRVVHARTGDRDTRDLAAGIGREGLALYRRPAFVVVSGGIATDGERIVRGLEDAVGDDVTVFGGLAGDDFKMTGTYAFTNGHYDVQGLVALILDEDKISVAGLATSGWQPVGTVRTVTRSEGNVVYTIDDEPALDLMIKYMGVSKNIDELHEVIVNVGSEFPMQIQRENAAPIMRAPLFANKEDRSLVCAGAVPQGSKIRFSLPPEYEVIESVIEECAEIKARESPEGDALIMFSCKARHLSLGPMVSEEIEGVKDVWQTPMVGFFSYGEMGRSRGGKHEFHNNTCSLVVLHER